MSLHQLVVDAAESYPDNTAVTGPGGSVTYTELDRRANHLAHRLAAAGVRPGDRVVLWMDKSADTVAAMQAVLRLGAAYVPASGATPVARVAVIAADCAARLVGTTAALLSRAEQGHLNCLALDTGPEPAGDVSPVNHPADPDDLAYLLYTSGSTGKPKGVCVSHRNARAFVDWAAATVGTKPEDRFANHAPFTFDLSVLDLYAAFSAGAAVCLLPAELSYAPVRLVDFLHRERISVWYSVPSALILMMRDGGLLDRPAPPALRAVLFAGEPFPIGFVRRLAQWTPARLLNLYGPTETNVCTAHEVRPEDLDRDRPVPIGVATCGDRVWARRPDGGTAGIGDEGELIVDGPTVMRGYWGSPPQTGPYSTGDTVRVLDGGAFDYLGRTDHMVKVRGHRIELGEIESALNAHPAVAEAAVIVSGSGVDATLVAFVACVPGGDPGVLALKRHSAERLPTYMIAETIRFIDTLPRTPNGKVDRRALHEAARPAAKESIR